MNCNLKKNIKIGTFSILFDLVKKNKKIKAKLT